MSDKTVPYNIEAEQAVLGAVLIDPLCIYQVSTILNAGDFYLQKHAWIYDALRSLSTHRKPIDFLTLTSELESAGRLAGVGGAAYITQLTSVVPSAISVKAYAQIVADAAIRRRLLAAAQQVAKLAYDEDKPLDEVLDGAETQIFNARGQRNADNLLKAEVIAEQVYSDLETAQNSGEPLVFSTGYTDLDYKMKLRRGELTLVAARTSMGKTALLLNVAQRASLAGLNVLFFSLEMTAQSLFHRLMVSEGRVTLDELSSGMIPNEKWVAVVDDMTKFSEIPLWVDDTSQISLPAIRAQALRLATETKIDLVCVDYIQLVKAGERTEKRYQEIGVVMRGLKALSKDLNCPVWAASQLRRSAEGVEPTLADLRESGDQEQDADNVLFIHRQRYGDGAQVAQVIIAKQRQGPTGRVQMVWIPHRLSFVPAAR